jgi:hypothetical protein
VNPTSSALSCVVEWHRALLQTDSEISQSADVANSSHAISDGAVAQYVFKIASGEPEALRLQFSHTRIHPRFTKPGLKRRIKGILRRRLSEMRDNLLEQESYGNVFPRFCSPRDFKLVLR